MLHPCLHRIGQVGTAARENGSPELFKRVALRKIWKHRFRPGCRGTGNDAPIHRKAADIFQGRPIGLGARPIGPRNFFRVLPTEQARVFTRNCKPRCSPFECLCHAVEQPARSRIKARIIRCLKTGKGCLVIRVKCCDQRRTRRIGMVRDAPHQRHRFDGCRNHQLLAGCQVEP